MFTCSPPSTLRANFTLPMLPAPIVFPRTQFPVAAGIVVLDFPVLPDCLDSCGVTTGAGPPPFAAALVMSDEYRLWLERRWPAPLDDSVRGGRGRSLLELLLDVCATFDVS